MFPGPSKMALSRALRASLASELDSSASDSEGATNPVASDDEGVTPLRLHPDADAQRPPSVLSALALRMQAACASGSSDHRAAHSPQLDPMRQLHVMQALQQQQLGPLRQVHVMQALQQQQQQLGPLLFGPGGPQHAQHAAAEVPRDMGGRPLPYACKTCPARFSHLNLLSRHAHDQHPVARPFLCPGCGRGYVHLDVMEAHCLKEHQGARPFPCPLCDKVFSRREYLQVHARVHTGARPYRCDECGRSFAWWGSLEYHQRTHTGERPYVCGTCSKDFTGLSTLKMHEMIHTDSFPFPCDQCERKFRRRGDLRDHAAMCYRLREMARTMAAEAAAQAQDDAIEAAPKEEPEPVQQGHHGVTGVTRDEEVAAVAALVTA